MYIVSLSSFRLFVYLIKEIIHTEQIKSVTIVYIITVQSYYCYLYKNDDRGRRNIAYLAHQLILLFFFYVELFNKVNLILYHGKGRRKRRLSGNTEGMMFLGCKCSRS